MTKAFNPCPLAKLMGDLALYFSRVSAANAALPSRNVGLELLAYDRWLAVHTGRCEQCNISYLEAAHAIAGRIDSAS